jgi:WD40 repeat protein
MIKYNSSESKIFSCGDDAVIKVWDIGKVKKCISLKGHTSSVSAFKIHNEN